MGVASAVSIGRIFPFVWLWNPLYDGAKRVEPACLWYPDGDECNTALALNIHNALDEGGI